MSTTAQDVAQWMLAEVKEKGYLDQYYAATQIEDRFGAEFTYENERGNPAISRKVLAAFRRLTEDSVVWNRWDRGWQLRHPGDPPGRKLE